jgi:hypothetical protein
LDCFTQIVSDRQSRQRSPSDPSKLLLIDAMSTSNVEEDVEVAEILQNQLYYNGDILDSSLSVVSQYKDQSVASVLADRSADALELTPFQVLRFSHSLCLCPPSNAREVFKNEIFHVHP